MRVATARTGAAGAFHAAAQLAQRGWAASLTIGNAPRTDIVAQHEQTRRIIAVQCKAANGGGDFHLGQRSESPSPTGVHEWFVLVSLSHPDHRPDFYVVPRDVVAAYIYVGYRAWRTGHGRDGKPHGETTMRNVKPREFSSYHEQWELLQTDAASVEYRLDDWFFGWAKQTGLPDGHPGIVPPAIDAPKRQPAESWVPALSTAPSGHDA